jgi:adenosylcobinamide kinase/adenosylcobinamide-phosphate guanylyltransferase
MTASRGRLILALGGARSGKSAFAQSRAAELSASEERRAVYIATAAALDREMRRRIEAHRGSRPAGWLTVEEPLLVGAAIEAHCAGRTVVIIDCLTILASNIMMERCAPRPDVETISLEQESAVQAALDAEVDGIVRAVRGRDCAAIIVSNEVGSGVVPPTPLGRLFRDAAGWANQRLARESDEVYLLVAGIPRRIK